MLKVPQCKYCNETPYLMAAMVSQGLTLGFTMTTVVKASYRLVPGSSLTPMMPQMPFRGDEWRGEDFHGALHHGSDLVMCKPRTDVLLHATCHVPGGMPTTHCEAGFGVGAWNKKVRVVGDRTWRVGLFGRRPGEAQPFTSMPLDWEHAYGGVNYADNPAGKGFDGDLLPNVEFPAHVLTSYRQKVPPAGFLPINRMWRSRMAKMGSANSSYLEKRFPLQPEDFDWTYFNEAPDDQQLEHPLRGDEQLHFSNLHPEVSEWLVRLPGTRIRCFVEDDAMMVANNGNGPSRIREVEMRCDTIFAHVDDGYIHLLWRGMLPIRSENRAEVRKFYLVEEPLDAPQPAEVHLAAMAKAKDMGEKLATEVEAAVAATKVKVAGILGRYGLAMPADPPADAKPGPSDQQLASFPFNPNGPLPPSAAGSQGDIDRASALREQAMQEFRVLGKANGVDVDGTPSTKPVNILADYKKGLEDSITQLTAQGQPVPKALRDQLKAVSTPGGDPFGIGAIAAEFKKAGMDLGASGNPLAVALASGDTATFLAAAQNRSAASPNSPLPGATPAPATSAVVSLSASAVVGAGTQVAVVDITTGVAFPPPAPRPVGAMSRADTQAFIDQGSRFTGQVMYGADCSQLDLSGHDFTGAMLNEACFRGAKLVGATFSSTLLRNADFIGADLRGAKLNFGDYQGADFSGACLAEAVFNEVAFCSCRFAGADLRGATLNSVLMESVDFSGANLGEAMVAKGVWLKCRLDQAHAVRSCWSEVLITESSLLEADFSRATIHDSVLMGCSAQRLRLVAADLKGMRAFNGTDLQGAVLVGAMMRDTSWMYVRLDEADFSHGDLRQANFMFSSCLKTRFTSADLKLAMLRHARLQGADLRRANLCQATFGRADLTLADLRESNCYETDFQDAITLQAHFEEANLIKTNLRRA